MLGILVLRYMYCAGHTYWCLDICTVLGILVLRYYWCLDICTVLDILALRYMYCAGHTGA